MKIYLEFTDANSAKFWQVSVNAESVITQWGKIGTVGQSKTKSYDSPEAAEKDALKQKNAKLKKGYVETSSDSSVIVNPTAKAPMEKAAATPKKPVQEAIDPSSAPKAKLVAWCKAEERSGTELEQTLGRFPESDRAIANRHDCPSHILSELSHSSDKSTRSKVASNVNTPRDDFPSPARTRHKVQHHKEAASTADASLSRRLSWAERLKRTFKFDVTICGV